MGKGMMGKRERGERRVLVSIIPPILRFDYSSRRSYLLLDVSDVVGHRDWTSEGFLVEVDGVLKESELMEHSTRIEK